MADGRHRRRVFFFVSLARANSLNGAVMKCWGLMFLASFGLTNCLFGLEFGEPGNMVGAANSFGNLVLSGHLGSVRFSKEEEYPFRYQFTSYREAESPHLGKGFFVPLLESSIIDHDWLLERTTLGGSTHFLYRSAHDPNHYDSLDLSETAERRGSGSGLTVTTGDGFEMDYRDGRLMGFKTPGSARVVLRYDGDVCAAVDSSGMGSAVAFTARGKETREIRTHAGTCALRMQAYTATDGSPGEPPMTLAEIGWPDGQVTTFAFSVTQKPSRARLDIAYGGASMSYIWNPANDELLEAGGIRYMLAPLRREYDPTQEHIESGTYRIERAYPDRTRHVFIHDEDRGLIEETQRDGTQTVTYVFTARGPTYGRVRKKERLDSGGQRHAFYEAFYDVKGRAIREVTEGRVMFHIYPDGKFDERTLGPEDDFRKYDPRGRLVQEKQRGTVRTIAYLPNGDRKITTRDASGQETTEFISAENK